MSEQLADRQTDGQTDVMVMKPTSSLLLSKSSPPPKKVYKTDITQKQVKKIGEDIRRKRRRVKGHKKEGVRCSNSIVVILL